MTSPNPLFKLWVHWSYLSLSEGKIQSLFTTLAHPLGEHFFVDGAQRVKQAIQKGWVIRSIPLNPKVLFAINNGSDDFLANVAQLVEQLIRNQQVSGSNPLVGFT